MSDKDKQDKGLLARTATYTTKRARRAQTKLKQRVGKGDETKDEVFDEFVFNFNKQQAVAARLYNEMKNYLRCISAMQMAATTFGEAVQEVYEDDWTGRDTILKSFAEATSNWTKLSISLTDEVLEPLIAYQKPFPDVKIRINKRARKLVDYDHSRHIVDTLRAKGATKSGDVKKLNQAEEEYQRAKDVFIELTSELYEELPALYDSRIGFYVSCFQSIFTLEEVFHRETSYIAHQLNDLMDQLITDFSAGTYSTRKPFSAGLETTSNPGEKEGNEKLSTGSLATFYDVAMPQDDHGSVDSVESNELISSEQSLNEEYIDTEVDVQQQMKRNSARDSTSSTEKAAVVPEQPVRAAPGPPPLPDRPVLDPQTSDSQQQQQPEAEQHQEQSPQPLPQPSPPQQETNENGIEVKPTPFPSIEPTICQKVDALSRTDQPPDNNNDVTQTPDTPPPPQAAEPVEIKSESNDLASNNIIAYKNIASPNNTNKCNLIVPSALYKVVTTHKYTPEDEDELSFERGEVVHVIPYEDPDEQDEGWLMGVMDSNGLVGVFPENFSKVVT